MRAILYVLLLGSCLLCACDGGHGHSHGDGTHTHDDGSSHSHESAPDEHEEVSLGATKVGDLELTLAQGHGKVAAGKECHLVVKLPYKDDGATAVRVWLGTPDRTTSLVTRAEYATDHDDYDAHAMAPDPLPEEVRWWIELEQPDGTKLIGSADPLK